ncbi:hypothetical protein PQO03_08220 [Lentisphaera profundi]|uniref:Bulb-type lectin domain-containing protein n=1 Tax=Lentisphaera profundi TaxID=1658616 RepID=A0ABY7VPG2_9BACT|nr:hypothetical protein [Lentisphaera profundi]WDE95701.1 hypothetical protein PQO03_08220 [Lentisphaera profundi]
MTALYKNWTKTCTLVLFVSLTNLAFSATKITLPKGEQRSQSGITHSFLVTGPKTCIVNEKSEVTWQINKPSRDGYVLPNGNILIAFKNEVNEYDKDQKIVWTYKLSKENKEMGTVQRLDNGNTLIPELGNKPRLLEVSLEGKISVEIALQPETDNAHMQTRMARKLPNGNYIVPHLLAFALKEYDSSGKVVNVIKTDLEELGGRKARNWPFTAILLQNGNFLINLTNGNKTVEMTPKGEVVWNADNKTSQGKFADPCGGQELDNGNRVICSYGQRKADKARIFELDKDKNVVWEFYHPQIKAHEVHIISTNGKNESGKLR